MNTETSTYLNGFRGAKVHAVNPNFRPTISLCGWGVEVGDTEFKPLTGLTCKVCEKAAR